MSLEQMEGIIEAVLFTMGDSVEAGKLAHRTGCGYNC